MRKIVLILVLLLGGAAAGYAVLGGYTPLYTSDKKILRDQTQQFWEYVKFKSFDRAAEFDQNADKEETARLLERIFKIKPENLDLREIDVLYAEIDGSGDLGRTKTRIDGAVLNPAAERTLEVMLFWEREEGRWWLKLRSSLE